MIRPLLMLITVLGACFLTVTYSEHHAPGKTPFETLYMHLVPAPMVTGHGEHHADAAGEAHHSDEASDEQEAAAAGSEHEHADHGDASYLRVGIPGFLGLFDFDKTDEGTHLVVYNLQVFQITAILLILIAFSGVARYLKTGEGDRVSRTLAGFCDYIRDEIVYPNVGKEHGAKLLPLFFSVFFFILFMNLCGLVPGSVTPTASLFVTAGLALITFSVMVIGGMIVQGPLAYWKNLVPHVPLILWPLLFVVELIGLTVKPVALTIRLFANMTGGHMVVLSFMGLIFFFGMQSAAIGYASAPVAIGFAVFIMIIEGFVAFVQAYVFTVLSAIFVGLSLHPEH